MPVDQLLGILGLTALCVPLGSTLVVAVPWAFGFELPEKRVTRLVGGAFALTILACLAVDVLLIVAPVQHTTMTLAHWVVMPHYSIDARVVFDRPAATLMTLTAVLCGLIGAFSGSYLHRDEGFHRFFILLPLFATGMMAIAVADTLDLLYAGWEFVGLSSALLIAYFATRKAPVRHGLRAFAVYRICDVALFTAIVLLHHGAGDASPAAGLRLGADEGLVVALLLIFASLGKSATFPFTGWLPRAMEGPTPSSAIFYGALSIHAGPYLLIRVSPLLMAHPTARVVLAVLAGITALHATTVGRTQTDIKTSLGYASVAQVAFIGLEIAAGWTTLALWHIAGHAILRTWQLLRSPSVLHDHHQHVALTGGHSEHEGTKFWLTNSLARRVHTLAIERWLVDDMVRAWIATPLFVILNLIDGADQRWARLLSGAKEVNHDHR